MISTDTLLSVLEDEGNQKLLRKALSKALKNNPLEFYKDFVVPRSSKLISVPSTFTEFAKLSPSEEMHLMDRLTTGVVATKETKLVIAQDFLERMFEESESNEIDSATILKVGQTENINYNQIYAARKILGIKCRREGRRKNAKSLWYLPTEKKNDKVSNQTVGKA